MAKIGEIAFPGDILNNIKSTRGVTLLGPGLRRLDNNPKALAVTRAGKLFFKLPNIYWVEGKQSRYVPKKSDLIIGTVVKKSGDSLKIDIGSSELAALSMFSFEGATKKQRPDLQIGDVVYARLLNSYRVMEPELICIDQYYKAGILGILSNDGFVMNISLDLVNRLLNVENPLLRTIAKKFPYEIVIGMNGKVWINARDYRNVLSVVRILEAAEFKDDQNIIEICRQFK